MTNTTQQQVRPGIIVVEDHDALRRSLHRWLSMTYPTSEILLAKNGEEAVALVRSRQVDVILMDIELPGMNGIEATRRVKEIDPQAQVVIVTIKEGQDYQKRAEEAGANAYVPKRTLFTDLLPIITSLLESKRLCNSVRTASA